MCGMLQREPAARAWVRAAGPCVRARVACPGAPWPHAAAEAQCFGPGCPHGFRASAAVRADAPRIPLPGRPQPRATAAMSGGAGPTSRAPHWHLPRPFWAASAAMAASVRTCRPAGQCPVLSGAPARRSRVYTPAGICTQVQIPSSGIWQAARRLVVPADVRVSSHQASRGDRARESAACERDG